MDIRPRTTGEILDDAWRLYRADAPLLLALTGLFSVPTAVLVLLLLALPRPESWLVRPLLPALVALAVPFTGLGSAACQEVFRLRAEDKPIGLTAGVFAALRRCLDHAAARAIVLLMTVPTLFCLLMPGLAIWVGSATIHPILSADELRWPAALLEASRQSQRNATRMAVVTLSRLALFVILFLNLHSLLAVGLWILDHLAGLDLAVTEVALTLSNPVYVTVLALLSWLLLMPYAEACNYLLYLDARTRFEGLDLWYRVRRHFPVPEPSKTGALALVVLLLATAPASADDRRRDTIRHTRQEMTRIIQEVNNADPYPGPERWMPGLLKLAINLNEDGGKRGRLGWFDQGVAEFGRSGKDRAKAVPILTDLEIRLALLEESLAPPADSTPSARTKKDIKALLPPDTGSDKARPETARKKDEIKRPVRRENTVDDGPSRRSGGGSGVLPPVPLGGLGNIAWTIITGLLIASVVVAFALYIQQRSRRPQTVTRTEKAELSLEALLAQTGGPIGENLWRQADELARSGQWLEAVRTLYLAVLAQLHRADLIRYAQTRTNGEYLDELRPRPEIFQPFAGLTSLFEVKFYGEKACQPDDFKQCRRLAEQVRSGISL